jgi:hypothetical protein
MVGSVPQESSTLAGSTIEITAKLQRTGGSLYPIWQSMQREYGNC